MLRSIFATAAIIASLTAMTGTASANSSCPAWTTAKCVKTSCTGPLIGGSCTCTEYKCVADKASDPIKAQAVRKQSRPSVNAR